MSDLGRGLLAGLDDEDRRSLAAALAPFLDRPAPAVAAAEWLNAVEAAAYLRCPVSRVRKVTMTGELEVERDGRRVLYRRDALDAYVRGGGAKSP